MLISLLVCFLLVRKEPYVSGRFVTSEVSLFGSFFKGTILSENHQRVIDGPQRRSALGYKSFFPYNLQLLKPFALHNNRLIRFWLKS